MGKVFQVRYPLLNCFFPHQALGFYQNDQEEDQGGDDYFVFGRKNHDHQAFCNAQDQTCYDGSPQASYSTQKYGNKGY